MVFRPHCTQLFRPPLRCGGKTSSPQFRQYPPQQMQQAQLMRRPMPIDQINPRRNGGISINRLPHTAAIVPPTATAPPGQSSPPIPNTPAPRRLAVGPAMTVNQSGSGAPDR